MNLITFSSRATTAVVAGVAGFSSYRHIVEVAQRAGEHASVAVVVPLSIDGLIVVGTMAMVEDKRAGRRQRLSARVALGFGIVATLTANVASAQPHLMARMVAAVPAVAFLITVEVLARTGRSRTDVSAAVSTERAPEPAEDPSNPMDNLSTPEPVARKPHPSTRERVERAHRRTPAATPDELAKRLNLSTKTVRRYRPKTAEEAAQLNGHLPQLEEVG